LGHWSDSSNGGKIKSVKRTTRTYPGLDYDLARVGLSGAQKQHAPKNQGKERIRKRGDHPPRAHENPPGKKRNQKANKKLIPEKKTEKKKMGLSETKGFPSEESTQRESCRKIG